MPSLFTRIRAASGVSEPEFEEEWDPLIVAQNFASKGSGKSGALFVMSKTRKYLLKTLRKEEKDALVEMAVELAEVRQVCDPPVAHHCLTFSFPSHSIALRKVPRFASE